MECNFLEGCPFFNDQLADMPSTSELYKKTVCQNDPESCARLIVRRAKGKDAVPADLFPNEVDRAAELIES